jgi:hypothetical protein
VVRLGAGRGEAVGDRGRPAAGLPAGEAPGDHLQHRLAAAGRLDAAGRDPLPRETHGRATRAVPRRAGDRLRGDSHRRWRPAQPDHATTPHAHHQHDLRPGLLLRRLRAGPVGGSLNLNTTFGANWYTQLSPTTRLRSRASPRCAATTAASMMTPRISHRPAVSRTARALSSPGLRLRPTTSWRELRLRGWSMLSSRDRLETVAGYALQRLDCGAPCSCAGRTRLRRTSTWRSPPATTSDESSAEQRRSRVRLAGSTDRWRFQGLTPMDSGYSDELADLNLRVTRDLHCWLASLTATAW